MTTEEDCSKIFRVHVEEIQLLQKEDLRKVIICQHENSRGTLRKEVSKLP